MRMRSMSLTPVPVARDIPIQDAEETVTTNESDESGDGDGIYDWKEWTHDQRNGDRAQIRDSHHTVEEELDISEYICINGIVFHKSNIETLDLTM